jgi:uncharacterized membrane protein
MYKDRQFNIQGASSAFILVMMLVYPLLVYQHIEDVSPRWFAGVLFIVLVLRFIFFSNVKKITDWLMLGVVFAFCLIVMVFESKLLLKFYPVLMNFGMGLIFIVSLTGKQSLIEKFVKATGKTPPPEARSYLRTLSLLWGGLLIFNGAVSAYTAWYTSLYIWAIYNGMLSYVLIASFAAGEWIYRGHYKKKHNIVDD